MTEARRISVVVALYNTGAHLRELVASLDAQTMAPEDFEVVLVDDGSTDGTRELAGELASTRPNLVVESIPNSGWPGRPRNVGMDLARGDYIFFSDHDDTFGPRALERMHACAVENDSDIVYGKIVRTGRSTPYWSVWERDVAQAGPELAMQSRTVHKLYRRSMLLEHDIRFREGRVRLEDHEFTALALSRARVVSIVASEPCYHWIHRTDGSNNSDNPVSPQVYWGHYRQVLETWRQVAGPGELLDTARLVSAAQAFTRFPPRTWFDRSEESRRAVFAAVHPLFRDHFPPELDARMPVLKRLRAQALRAGDAARFSEMQRLRQRFVFISSVETIESEGDALHVELRARCVRSGRRSEKLVRREGERVVLLLDGVEASTEDRTLLASDLGRLELTIRHRGTGVEWPIHTQTTRPGEGLDVTTDAVVDLRRDTFGTPLEDGVWDLLVRVEFLGETVVKPVECSAGPLGPLPEGVTAAEDGPVSFRVGGAADGRARAQRLSWRGRALLVELTPGSDAVQVAAGLRGEASPRVVADVGADRALVELDDVPEGDVTVLHLWVVNGAGVSTPLAYEGARVDAPPFGSPRLSAYGTADNSLAVRRTQPATHSQVLRRRALARARRSERIVDVVRRLRG